MPTDPTTPTATDALDDLIGDTLTDRDGGEETPPVPNADRVMATINSINFDQGPVTFEAVDALEQRLIMQALRLTHGNTSEAAKILGIPRDMLRYRKKKWDITYTRKDYIAEQARRHTPSDPFPDANLTV